MLRDTLIGAVIGLAAFVLIFFTIPAIFAKKEKHVCPPTSSSSPWMNIEWFGANGQDTLSDQQAFDIAKRVASELGGTIYIPKGVYHAGPIVAHRPDSTISRQISKP